MHECGQALNEWAFRFRVVADGILPMRLGDDVMDFAVRWAEGKGLGIGGGYCREGKGLAFSFGLAATRPGELVSKDAAHQLLNAIRSFVAKRTCRLNGEFRPYSEDDLRPLQ